MIRVSYKNLPQINKKERRLSILLSMAVVCRRKSASLIRLRILWRNQLCLHHLNLEMPILKIFQVKIACLNSQIQICIKYKHLNLSLFLRVKNTINWLHKYLLYSKSTEVKRYSIQVIWWIPVSNLMVKLHKICIKNKFNISSCSKSNKNCKLNLKIDHLPLQKWLIKTCKSLKILSRLFNFRNLTMVLTMLWNPQDTITKESCIPQWTDSKRIRLQNRLSLAGLRVHLPFNSIFNLVKTSCPKCWLTMQAIFRVQDSKMVYTAKENWRWLTYPRLILSRESLTWGTIWAYRYRLKMHSLRKEGLENKTRQEDSS